MTAPTLASAALFSATLRVAVFGVNTGAALVEPLPEGDQSPAPSSLVARTWTS